MGNRPSPSRQALFLSSELKQMVFTAIRRRNSLFLTKSQRKKCKNTLNISLKKYLQGNTSVFETVLRNRPKVVESLRGGNHVQNLGTF